MRAKWMISKTNVKFMVVGNLFTVFRATVRLFNNKPIITFVFCDIRNNQGLGKCYQPKPKAEADNTYRDLDYSGYHKNLI